MLVLGTFPQDYFNGIEKNSPNVNDTPTPRSHIFQDFYFDSQLGIEEPVIFDSVDNFVAIVGTPFYKNNLLTEIANPNLLQEILSKSIDKIDSCFLIINYNKVHKLLSIYTDRFGTYVFFFVSINNFIAFSASMSRLYSLLAFFKAIKADTKAIFEFIWFRRLFGGKTYVSEIRSLPPATVCTVKTGQTIEFRSYWHPKPTQSNQYMKSNEWAGAIKTSLIGGAKLATSLKGNHALMLSGGLDSRALLAVGREKYHSITNTPSKNDEYHVAKQLADVVGSRHDHILRPSTYLDGIFEQAIQDSNGMTVYYESQFLGYTNYLTNLAETVHMGLFFDVFFCGHYMPKKHHTFLNRNSHYFVLDTIPEQEFEKYYCNNISYRQKFTNLSDVINPSSYQQHFDSLTFEIGCLVQQGREHGFSGIELWEYLHLINLGRHYSMLMARSLRPYINVQLPALTIENYDLAFALPVSEKYNWSAYLKALRDIDPQLMSIINSNTHNPARNNLYTQTLKKLAKGLFNVIHPGQFKISPEYSDRSWPPVRDSLKPGSLIANLINEMVKSGRILELGLLDVANVRKCHDATLNGQEDHSVFLNQLLTIEKGFLEYM